MDIFRKLFSSKDGGQTIGKIEYAIVGLGNPGRKYENTRHNAGFIAIDCIAEEFGVDLKSAKFSALYGICEICGKKVILLKPQTLMNSSGKSVQEMVSFYRMPLNKVIVLFDDISLPVGRIRIRKGGSHGGQNGMKNIIALLGTDNIPRIRIGIGQKPNEKWDLADWVLSKFTAEDRKQLDCAVRDAKDAVKIIISQNIDKAMNEYN